MSKTVCEILELLEQTPGRLDKEEIMREHSRNKLLVRAFVAVTDPYVDYGVKKFKKVKLASAPSHEIDSDDFLIDFLDVLELLARRDVVGNSARHEIEERWLAWSDVERKWFERILLKNLRCGVSESIVEKTWPGLVKKFAVQLAEVVTSSFVDGKLILEDVSFPVRVEPKLDGLRLIAIKENGDVKLYTRNGNVIETLPRIAKAIADLPIDDVVFDGEAMASDAGTESWNESAKVIMARKTLKDDSKIVFNIFDSMCPYEWRRQHCDRPLYARVKEITKMLEGVAFDSPLEQVGGVDAVDSEGVQRFYESCLNEGYEGVMLKDRDALYKFKRSSGVLKLKPCVTHEGIIVGWYGGNVGTKHEGLFGGFNVLLPNGIITRVGGGFNDTLRAQIQLESPEVSVGKVVECECQPPLTEEGKMRFPVFCRFRDASDIDPKILEAYIKWEEAQLLEHGVFS